MSNQNCLFCRVIAGKIPADIVYKDEQCLAFRDINPQAPVHLLVIPREHLKSLNEVAEKDEELLGHLLLVAGRTAREQGIAESGYRTVINSGGDAGQSVFHLHLHVLGGRSLNWPPG